MLPIGQPLSRLRLLAETYVALARRILGLGDYEITPDAKALCLEVAASPELANEVAFHGQYVLHRECTPEKFVEDRPLRCTAVAIERAFIIVEPALKSVGGWKGGVPFEMIEDLEDVPLPVRVVSRANAPVVQEIDQEWASLRSAIAAVGRDEQRSAWMTGASPVDRPPQEGLRSLGQNELEVLEVLLAAKAFDSDHRLTADAVARRAGAEAVADNYKRNITHLRKLGLLGTKAGRNGGCWLTDAGKARASSL